MSSRLLRLAPLILSVATACGRDAAVLVSPVQASAIAMAMHDDAAALAEVRAATARYHQVETALADGYVSTPVCAALPGGAGAMGIHYVNPMLRHDATFDPTRPELLLYEPQKNGKLRLVAVEYVITRSLWDAAHPGTIPTYLGHPFFQSFGPAAHGEPDHYELHVWLWRHNPDGVFAQWNPMVSCP
jgi:hypothetical protein